MTFNQLRRLDLAVRRKLTLADFAERMAEQEVSGHSG